MLHLVQSNKMEVLEAQLIAIIKQRAKSNEGMSGILVPNTILVQSPGMAQWLKIRLAESLGIAANFEFPLPSSYIWSFYSKYFSDLPKVSAYSKANMAWKLLSILPDFTTRPEFSEINAYLTTDTGLRSYQLCQKIADVFDQYQMYRPEWILSWEQGQDALNNVSVETHPWQPVLWRALVEKTKALQESKYHRANLHQQLLVHLELAESTSSTPQKPLYVFGISALPQQQLEVLERIAISREVYLFWCNPSQHYWGDLVDEKYRARSKLQEQNEQTAAQFLESGNPLLSSWGKLGRDYQEMLLNLDVEQTDLFVDEKPETLLGWVQHEIFDLTMRNSNAPLSAQELLTNGDEFPKIEINPNDDSIQFHRCHSKVRELEVLHDFLLHQFKRDSELSPGDIIVMMPDVASYAPYISGVFGSVEASLHIPFAISDRNAAQESKVINSFIQLISLHQSRLTLSELLSLLEVPAIQQKFEISDKEYEEIRHWLTDVGVRWGWDSHDKSRWDLPEQSQNTLLFGLNRLLAGYALNGDNLFNADCDIILPYADVEGQQALALGKLFLFCEKLNGALSYCQQHATLQNKVSIALSLIDEFYLVDENEQVYINQLRQALEEIALHQSHFPDQINQDVFVCEIEQNLESKGVGQRFLAGSINFCTLMPMRSIPFSRVCLLGLNDTDYPRNTMPIGFDLMQKSSPKRGDRSRRFDDRYLFLEAIISARKQLYLSYQGFNARDNSECNPSILVNELLDYCGYTFCLTGEQKLSADQTRQNVVSSLIHSHGLQPFSAKYFAENPSTFRSFQTHWMKVLLLQQDTNQQVSNAFFDTELSPLSNPSDLSQTLEVNDLISFLLNPAKGLFHQRWRTSLQLFHQEIEDDEPFALDGLDRYLLSERLLDEQITNSSEVNTLNRARAEGLLPFGVTGDISAEQIINHTRFIVELIQQHIAGKVKSRQEVDIELDNVRLVGWIDNIYDIDLILIRSGEIRAKDKLTLWIKWLCLCAVAERPKSCARFLGIKQEYQLKYVPQQLAMSQLSLLLNQFNQGMTAPLHFYVESAYVWVTTQDVNRTLSKFAGNDFQPGESSEANIARLCPDLSAVFEQFEHASVMILGNLRDYEVKS